MPTNQSKLIKGIVGVIRLIAGPYLIVITAAEHVGSVYGQKIYRIKETELVSYSRTLLHLTEEQVQFNNTYLAMVRTVLNTQHFYFCTTYDLTHTIQRLFNAGPEFMSMSLFDRVSVTRMVRLRSHR